jgi:putative copper resistance protein D
VISAPDILSVVLRAIWFVLLFQAGGASVFVAAFGSGLPAALAKIQRLGAAAAALAMVFLCGHYSLEAARMAGDFTGVLDASLQGLVLRSPTSEALVLRLAGLGLIILSLRISAVRARPVGLIGVLFAAIAFTLVGHTSDHPYRPLLALLLLTHVLIGMFWFGSLLPLWLVSAREPAPVAGRVVESFSAAAVWLVPLLLLAGLALTAILVPGWSTFAQPYGELLLAKLVLFAGLMGLAAANRRRFGPGIAAGSPAAAAQFRKTVAAEVVLICGVLAVTAALTMFFSPD